MSDYFLVFIAGFVFGATLMTSVVSLGAYLVYHYLGSFTIKMTESLYTQQNILYQHYLDALGFKAEVATAFGDDEEDDEEGEESGPQRF